MIGLGSLHLLPLPGQRQRLIHVALDAGLRHFDVAPMYGNGLNEIELGLALGTLRHECTIATKFGIPFRPYGEWSRSLFLPLRLLDRLRPAYRSDQSMRDFSAAMMRRSVESSLRRLRTDHVNYLLLHEPPADASAIPIGELLAEAQALQANGMVLGFGVAGERACSSPWTETPGLDLLQAPVPAVLKAGTSIRRRAYSPFRYYRQNDPQMKTPFPEFLRRLRDSTPGVDFVFATKSDGRLRELARTME